MKLNYTLFARLSCFIFLQFGPLFVAQGSPRKPPLAPDMSYGDVLRLWGDPLEKTVKETSRIEIWEYKTEKVIFTAGKVSAWSGADQQSSLASSDGSAQVEVEKVIKSGNTAKKSASVEVEDILKEIVKESPDDDSTASKSATYTNLPAPINSNVPIMPVGPAGGEVP